MRTFVLDTNLYVDADRDRAKAEERIGFYSAFLPFTYLHAAVAQELLAGGRTDERRLKIREDFIEPFEKRGRVLVPTYAAWRTSG